jgi:hypothetical protein
LNFLLGSGPASPRRPASPSRPLPPPHSLGVFTKRRLSFKFAHFSNYALSLSVSVVTAMRAPPISFIPFPTLNDPGCPTASSHNLQPPRAARHRASGCRLGALTPPPSNPPPGRLPSPYKRESAPPEQAAPSPLALELSLDLLRPRVELVPLPFSTVIAPPLRRRSCSDECLYGSASSPSPSSATVGKLR